MSNKRENLISTIELLPDATGGELTDCLVRIEEAAEEIFLDVIRKNLHDHKRELIQLGYHAEEIDTDDLTECGVSIRIGKDILNLYLDLVVTIKYNELILSNGVLRNPDDSHTDPHDK